MKFKDFLKGGKFVRLQSGESVTLKLACDPYNLRSRPSQFNKDKEVIEYLFEDPETGEEKVFTNGSAKVASVIAEAQEGDLIRLKKIETDGGQTKYVAKVVGATEKSSDDDDEEKPRKAPKGSGLEVDEDDEDETPKKKKRVEEDEDDEEEEEKPKKKKRDEDEDDEEDEAPKKKKKKDEVDPDDLDF